MNARECIIEHGIDRAGLAFRRLGRGSAFNLHARDLDCPDDVADPDRRRRLCKSDTAARAPDRRQKTGVGEDVNDFEDVLLGDAEALGNICHFHELVAGQRAIDQNADGMAGLLRQAHRVLTRSRAARGRKT